jgi:hypothetical protein
MCYLIKLLSDSGHGSQQEDEDGDEKDGIDEGAPPSSPASVIEAY